jgi:multisubunit Na+/H+ antiporter MnhB subunit
MERYRTARNILIVLAIGAAVYYVPGGGRAANAVEAALWVLFALGFAYLGLRLYRENQFTLSALGDRHRGLLYGGVALALFCFMARVRMWESGLGELAWFVLVGLAVYCLMEVYRHSRSYS